MREIEVSASLRALAPRGQPRSRSKSDCSDDYNDPAERTGDVPWVNSGCTREDIPTIGSPKCAADGSAPPLAPGDYQIAFQGLGAFGSLEIPPVTVQVH